MAGSSYVKSTFAILVVLGIGSAARAAMVWDAAADFSSIDNPNGVWSYGWSATLGGTFILDTDFQVFSGLDQWRSNLSPTGDGTPLVEHNGTAGPITADADFHRSARSNGGSPRCRRPGCDRAVHSTYDRNI